MEYWININSVLIWNFIEVMQWFEKSSTKSSGEGEDGINILITGFGPFRDHVVNASWEAVKLLNPDGIPWPSNISRGTPLHISFCQLEVAYKVIHTQVPGLWDKQKPHVCRNHNIIITSLISSPYCEYVSRHSQSPLNQYSA
jgi:hypothetical protein